jgi:hypothetical protein
VADEYDRLPPDTRAGLDREYFEQLSSEEQRALIDSDCIEPGCFNPRWLGAGSFYCEEHAALHSLGAYEAHGVELEDH